MHKTLKRLLNVNRPIRIVHVTWVLKSPYPDQEGNKLGSMSGTCVISTTSRRELSSSTTTTPPPPARQGAEGNSRHSERNVSLFPSWSG